MTELLQRAFDRASELPENQQDEFARFLLAELDSERRWDELFSLPESDDLLDRLADDALDAHKAGRTRPAGRPSLRGGSLLSNPWGVS